MPGFGLERSKERDGESLPASWDGTPPGAVKGGCGGGARWRTAATGGERAPAARAGAAVRWLGWGVRPGLLEVVTVCLQVGLVGPIMGPWAYTTGLACLVRSNSLLSEEKKNKIVAP